MKKTREQSVVDTIRDPQGSGWVVRERGEIVSRHRTKKTAVEKGRSVARATGAKHRIHRSDGSLGRVTAPRGGSAAARPGAFVYGERKAGFAVTSTYPMRLRSARTVFSSDAQVAEALGVNRAQVKRWLEGATEPGDANADRVIGLDAVVALLTGYLETGSIAKWLRGTNAHLGNRRPIDMLREGNLSDVVAAIEALKSGSYA